MIMLTRAYDPQCMFRNFPDLDQRLARYYDRVYHTAVDYHITPRYFYETGLRIAFRDIFYYIDMLYDHDPHTVIDVGCGECVWKRWFPNIVGFDPNTNEFSQQDFVDYFDQDFSEGHAGHYDSGMALNSLHFVDWHQVPQQIHWAMNIVRDRFLFTFNFDALDDAPQIDLADQISEFYTMLHELPYDLVMFDSPLHRGVAPEHIRNFAFINGTVRFVLQRRDHLCPTMGS